MNQGPCRFIRRVNKLLARLAMRKLLHLPRKVAGADAYGAVLAVKLAFLPHKVAGELPLMYKGQGVALGWYMPPLRGSQKRQRMSR